MQYYLIYIKEKKKKKEKKKRWNIRENQLFTQHYSMHSNLNNAILLTKNSVQSP